MHHHYVVTRDQQVSIAAHDREKGPVRNRVAVNSGALCCRMQLDEAVLAEIFAKSVWTNQRVVVVRVGSSQHVSTTCYNTAGAQYFFKGPSKVVRCSGEGGEGSYLQ